jgi:hypothetical protein
VTAAASAVSAVCVTLLGSTITVGMMAWQLQPSIFPDDLFISIEVARPYLLAALTATVISGAQVALLRHHIPDSRRWVIVTLVASRVSFAIAATLRPRLGITGFTLERERFEALIDGVVIGSLQGWVLTRNVHLARWWWLTVLDAEVLAAVVYFYTLFVSPSGFDTLVASDQFPDTWEWLRVLLPLNTALGLMIGAIQGCLTGLGLVLMLSGLHPGANDLHH